MNSIAATLADRPEDQRAAQDLRASEHLYRQFFDANPHVMWVYDPDTLAFLAVNQAAVIQYGYSHEEFLGRTILDIRPEGARAALTERAPRGIEQYRGTWRHETKHGRMLEVEVRVNLVEWNGTIACLALVDDLTERRQLEEQLRQSQRIEALGQLAGGIAHDFNNLLTAIMGYADLLTDSLPPDCPERRDLEEIARAGARAATLTQQLLAFSRRQILAPEVLRLGNVVDNLTPILGRLIGETIQLKAAATGRGSVKADLVQLEQVLVNLAVNARDAMPRGGTLTIETGDAELGEDAVRKHPSMRSGHYVTLAVSDTGCGMDAETLGRIFEPFFTTKPKGQGTGLGLSMVHGIVTQSGGFIEASSTPGQGSTFRIYLPRVEAPVDSRPRPAVHKTDRGSETVLLVEDDELVRELAEKVLRRHGYTVYTQPGPLRALEFSRGYRAPIDVLLIDVVMPDMNGRELAVEIAEFHPEARVLFMSGYTDASIVDVGVLEPGTWFLQKPFTAATLSTRMRELLDSSRLQVT